MPNPNYSFRTCLILSLLLLLCFSCTEKKEAEVQMEHDFLIKGEIDTIAISAPIPSKGRWINPDSVARPKIVPLKGKPKVVPAHPNVHPVGTPKVVPLPEKLTIITPGENGIPLPASAPVIGKRVPARILEPVPALPAQRKLDATYPIQFLGKEQGLLNSSISSTLEDSKGNLWIGFFGNGGVSRYDGYGFTHFTISEGLSNYGVNCMLEDRQGNLWLGTYHGINRFDGEYFTHYYPAEDLKNNIIFSLEEDHKGNLWVGTFGAGLFRFDGDSFTHYTTREGLSNNQVLSIFEDSQGILWIGTFEGGLNRFDGNTFTHFSTTEGLSNNIVYSIQEDSQGNLWFGTFNGLNRFDGKTFAHFTTREGLSDNNIRSIIEDRQGNLWFGTYNKGVNRFDGKTFTHFTSTEGLSSNKVRTVLEDSQGNFWFGTQNNGIDHFNPNSFQYFNTDKGLNDNNVYSILEDGQGRLWFGTAGGIHRFDGKTFTHFSTTEGLSHNSVPFMLEDSQGILWFGTAGGGINRFDGKTFTLFTTTEGLSNNFVYSILEDSRGIIWVGTYNGLNRFDGKSFTHYTTAHGLSSNEIYSILEDSQGILWVGTNGWGINRFDGNTFTHYDIPGVPIIEDRQRFLWFGNVSGLNRYKPDNNQGISTLYRIESKFGVTGINSFIEDKQHNIWMTSPNRGLSLLTSSFEGSPSADRRIFDFNAKEGFLAAGAGTSSLYLDTQNRLWSGSIRGLMMLDLNHFELPKEPPRPTLSYLKVMDKYVDFRLLSDTIYVKPSSISEALVNTFDSVAQFYNYPLNLHLPHNLNHLTFYFSAIDWAAPHQIKYSYVLQGLEDNWSLPKAENKVDYRNLPHGTFTLKVKAIGAAHIESEPFEYTFRILPPWWLTWWAYIIYSLVILLIVYFLYQYLLTRRLEQEEAKRIKEIDEVKTKLYTNITHEFRTPLTVIQGLNEIVEEEGKRIDNKKITDNTRIVKRNSDQLLRLVNQMLDLRKLESGSLQLQLVQGDVVAYLKYLLESFHSWAESKNIQLHFQSDQAELGMDYDPERLQQIVSNLLSNAIKFTPEGGQVHLNLQLNPPDLQLENTIQAGEHLLLAVKDNGIGIPEAQLPHIFDRFHQVDPDSYRDTRQSEPLRRVAPAEGTGVGLALTRELVKLLGGQIRVQSRPGEGTEFLIVLPISRNAPMAEALPQAAYVPMAPTEILPEEDGMLDEESPLALLIEDNLDVQQYLRACLAGQYRLESALDGEEGIEKALELVPDIIISDVMMPKQDGFAVTQTLKTDARTSHIPIILLTAKADAESRLEGLERGADAYLAKPFHKEELLLRMRKLQELRRRLRQYYLSLGGATTPVESPPEASPEQQLEDVFVQQVRELIETHLSDFDYSVEQLSQELAMSRSQLHRKITALTGYSANRFIRYVRLSHARRLLSETDEPIGNIAFDTGFSDPGYFTRAFRKEFGETPTECRDK